MKHTVAFSLLVFAPLVAIYLHQRNNQLYKGFKWSKYNDAGLLVGFCLFVFVLFADYVAPNFVIRFEQGWSSGRSNEYSYVFLWFVALLFFIFPHVCKRGAWPLYPTAMQAKSLHKTKWYRLGGGILVVLQCSQLVKLSS